MKLKERQALGQLIGAAVTAAFEHGMAMQRRDDAEYDEQAAKRDVHEALAPITALLNKPHKSELN